MITNISNAYIGDVSISRIYQGDELVYVTGHPDILCEWISNDSSTAPRPDVYFDTSVRPDTSTSVEISYQLSEFPVAGVGDIGVLFGCTHLQAHGFSFSGDFYMGVHSYKNGVWSAIRARALSDMDGQGTPDTNKHLYKMVTGNLTCTVYYDSSVYTSAISSQKTFDITAYLFSRNYENTSNSKSIRGTRIYYCKVWQSNNLIRFYIPVLHWNNGQYVPCFYDKVNDTYIYNLGTDAPTYKIQGDYLLDYLGAQPETTIPNTITYKTRYDSGVVAATSLATDTKFRLVYGKENFIFGSGTSAQTTPTWQQYSLLCPGNLYRVTFNAGSREEGAITAGLIADSSAVYDVHTISTYYEGGMGRAYLDNVLKWSSAFPVTYLSSNTIHMFNRHGDASVINAGAGSRIYYINFTKSNVPAKTYIPVFHNNQAAFLDLNSGTYIYNIGTDAPYYQFKR